MAPSWKGPYTKKTSTTPMPVPTNCEDAAVYVAPSGVYRVLFHCSCNYLVAVSADGTNYRPVGGPKQWCDVEFTDGTNETLRRRERPQWVMGPDGHPTHLMTGVLPAVGSGMHNGSGLIWTMAAPLL